MLIDDTSFLTVDIYGICVVQLYANIWFGWLSILEYSFDHIVFC